MTTQSADEPIVDRDNSTVTIVTVLGRIEIAVCTPRILRVRLAPEGPRADPSYLAPRAWPPVQCAIHDGPTTVIDTGRMIVRITPRAPQLLFGDSAGSLLLQGTVVGSPRQDPVARAPARSSVEERADATSGGVSARFEPLGEQHFYGLGEGGKQFDRLGSARQLWTSHLGHGPGSDIGDSFHLHGRTCGKCWPTLHSVSHWRTAPSFRDRTGAPGRGPRGGTTQPISSISASPRRPVR